MCKTGLINNYIEEGMIRLSYTKQDKDCISECIHESMIDSIYHQPEKMRFPVFDKELRTIIESKLRYKRNLSIMEDVNGYFVIANDGNRRSKSYPSIESIPNLIIDMIDQIPL